MTVEILLATYNGEKYIEELLESIKKQTYQEISLLIRDDGSTDNTVDLIERSLSGWDRPWRWASISMTTSGVINNFTALMSDSKADYMMFADQDDYWLPEKVEKTLGEMKRLEVLHGINSPLLVHSDLEVVDQSLNRIASSFWGYTKINPSLNTLNRLLIQNNVTGCAMMINRHLLSLALPIPKEALMHDWWLALVAAAFGAIGIVLEPTIRYRQHGKNSVGAQKHPGILIQIAKSFYALRSGRCRKAFRLKINFEFTYSSQQAAAFYSQYADWLWSDQKDMLQKFSHIQELTFFAKRAAIIKYRLFNHRWVDNLLVIGLI